MNWLPSHRLFDLFTSVRIDGGVQMWGARSKKKESQQQGGDDHKQQKASRQLQFDFILALGLLETAILECSLSRASYRRHRSNRGCSGKVLDNLPISLKCLFVLAYHIGVRKGALLGLTWSQVDLEERLIRFIRKESGKPVPVFAPIYGDMHHWLARQKEVRDRKYPECEFVFFWHALDCDIVHQLQGGHGGRRNEPGSPIKKFSASWQKATKDAGYTGLLFHDLRRSAVRNMVEKMGWSEKKAMMISGHKTNEMLRRYNIIPTDDIKESGRQADEWWRSQRTKRTKKLKVVRKGEVA